MDIKTIFKGTLYFSEEENGFFMPMRFSKEQLERYERLPNGAYAKANAGVLAEFYTDAKKMSFDYIVHKSWTTMFRDSNPTFDIFEDDVLYESIKLEYQSEGSVHTTEHIFAKAGKKKVTVVFPCNAVVSVANFDIGDFEPTKVSKRKFLIIGDSISQGLLDNTSSNNYPFFLRRFFGADYLNQSVGGDRFDASALMDINFEPTDVIVALGTNDMVYTGSLKKSCESIASFFEKFDKMYGGKNVTVITPPWITVEKTQPASYALLRGIAAETERVAKEYGYRVADGEKLVPHTERYYSDDEHPNDLGFAHYALNLIKELI